MRITSQKQLDDYYNVLIIKLGIEGFVDVTDPGRTRTPAQNNALHLWCRWVADELNANDISTAKFFKPGFELSFTEHIVKENMWKPIQEALFGSDSTKVLTTSEVSQIYDVLNRKLSEHGVFISWPERSE